MRPALARIEASEVGYRLARGAFWSLAGTVVSKSLAIAASIVVARTLGKVGFGELGIINSTVGLFQVFAGFGLGLTATKYVAEYRTSNPLKAGRIIGLAWMVSAITGSLCAALLFGLAPWLSAHALAAPHLSGFLRIASIALLISALNAAQNGALSGFEAFKTIATRNLVAGMLDFPIMVGGVLLAGLNGAIWAIVASRATNWFLCHLAIRSEARRFHVPLVFSGCLQELPIVWRFSLPAVLAGLMVTPINWLCSTMLVQQPNGYAEMGIYNAASQWRAAIAFLPMKLASVLMPVLTNEARKDSGKYHTSLDYIHRTVFVAAVPVTVLVMVASRSIMAMYGGSFSDGRTALILIVAATAISSLGSTADTLLQSRGKMWMAFAMNLSWGGVLTVIAFLLIPLYGATGLALAVLISYILLTSWAYFYQKSMLPKGMLKRTYTGVLILLGAASICVFLF